MRRRQNRGQVQSKEDDIRIGEFIQAKEVRLVVEDGPPEVVPLAEAIKKAEEQGLDVVQVSPDQEIPVVKIINYGKFKFDHLKKQKEAKKKQKVINIKEVKLRPKIDTHDYETKRNHAQKFLEKGDKVKVTVMFRGREMAHRDIGFTLINKFRSELEEYGTAEKDPQQEGPNLIMILNPKKKK